jgi:hypothetical protein
MNLVLKQLIDLAGNEFEWICFNGLIINAEKFCKIFEINPFPFGEYGLKAEQRGRPDNFPFPPKRKGKVYWAKWQNGFLLLNFYIY